MESKTKNTYLKKQITTLEKQEKHQQNKNSHKHTTTVTTYTTENQ